jgi:hypothetical protein
MVSTLTASCHVFCYPQPPEAAAVLSGRGKLKPPTRHDGEAMVDAEKSEEGSTHVCDDEAMPDAAAVFQDNREADILYACTCEMIATAAVCAGTLR